MALNRGGKAAEQEAAQRRTFTRADYFKLENSGDSVVVRFIDDSDDWVYIGQHSFVDTKSRPADLKSDEKWPDKMSAVCRKDKAFRDPANTPYYPDGCYICDHMAKPDGKRYWPQTRLWARAILREPVLATAEHVASGEFGDVVEGQRLGYRDAEQEIKDDEGQTKTVKKIVVINMGVKNFFGAMQGYYDVYGTVLDRDYHITRSGTGTDTDYKIVPLDAIPGHNLKSPELREKYRQHAVAAKIGDDDLEKMIIDLSTDDYYARYFDETKQAPKRNSTKSGDAEGNSGRGAPESEQTKPAEASIDQKRLAAMKDRVMGGNGPATAGASQKNFS